MRGTVRVGGRAACQAMYGPPNPRQAMAHLLDLVGTCATAALGRHALDRGSFEARVERFPDVGSQMTSASKRPR